MENKHPTSALVKSDEYTTSKAFSLLQHKDGSIKTRDQIAFMQKGIKRNRIIGTIAGVGFLAFFGTNLVATLDTGNTVSLFLIGLKYLPIILVLLLIALVAFPEARARIDELRGAGVDEYVGVVFDPSPEVRVRARALLRALDTD